MTRAPNGQLHEAMTLLVNSQATLVNSQATLANNQAAFLSLAREMHEDMALIRRRLDHIEAILLRHEQMLQALPEAIREKIGYKRS